jgi:hypothetical protein
VHRGQDKHEPRDGGRGYLDDLIDIALAEGLGDAVGTLADPDASGRVAEDHPGLAAEGE